MVIKTSTDLVRYIRHHLAGSEWQDVKAVDDYVKDRTIELVNTLKEALPTLRYSIDEGTQDWRREVRQDIYDRCQQVIQKYEQ